MIKTLYTAQKILVPYEYYITTVLNLSLLCFEAESVNFFVSTYYYANLLCMITVVSKFGCFLQSLSKQSSLAESHLDSSEEDVHLDDGKYVT